MENKVRFDGTLLNEVKLSEYKTCLLRVQNKREFTKKDGSQGETTYTAVVSCRGDVASQAFSRFKQGSLIRVEGSLMRKKTDKVDSEGNEIWETWINAMSINALPNGGSIAAQQKPIEERMGYTASMPATGPVHQPAQRPAPVKQPTPILKKNVNMVDPRSYTEPIIEENPFGVDDLPF